LLDIIIWNQVSHLAVSWILDGAAGSNRNLTILSDGCNQNLGLILWGQENRMTRRIKSLPFVLTIFGLPHITLALYIRSVAEVKYRRTAPLNKFSKFINSKQLLATSFYIE
jgi:hypothetical protein